MKICKHCKKEIAENSVQQGGLHMDCFGTEIDVWYVHLADEPENGYFEIDHSAIQEELKSGAIEEDFLVIKESMIAGRYHNLPEFDGF